MHSAVAINRRQRDRKRKQNLVRCRWHLCKGAFCSAKRARRHKSTFCSADVCTDEYDSCRTFEIEPFAVRSSDYAEESQGLDRTEGDQEGKISAEEEDEIDFIDNDGLHEDQNISLSEMSNSDHSDQVEDECDDLTDLEDLEMLSSGVS